MVYLKGRRQCLCDACSKAYMISYVCVHMCAPLRVFWFRITQLIAVFQSPIVSDSLQPVDFSTPGFPVPHHLPEFAQVHVHCIGETIQPSHPLMTSSPSAFNLSQHQGLFQWVRCSHQMTEIVELQFQQQSFQLSIQSWYPLRLTILISLLSKGLSGVFFSTTVWRHYFFGTLPSLHPALATVYDHGKIVALTVRTFAGRAMSLLFSTLSRLVITFLLRSNCLLISWL